MKILGIELQRGEFKTKMSGALKHLNIQLHSINATDKVDYGLYCEMIGEIKMLYLCGGMSSGEYEALVDQLNYNLGMV